MKIAFSGSACTGKTTLAKQLGATLDLPVIPEHFETLFTLAQVNSDKSLSKIEKSNRVIEAFKQVLAHKRAEEDALTDFIVDRCPLDLMNLWLTNGMSARPEHTKWFYQHCRLYMKQYDYVVIPPWGRLPLEALKTHSGQQVRNLNRWSLLNSHATITGLARMWLRPGQLILIPETLDSLEDRVGFVRGRIRRGQDTKTQFPVTSL